MRQRPGLSSILLLLAEEQPGLSTLRLLEEPWVPSLSLCEVAGKACA
jgi:PIN domain nuclease of toxin-antitoxin system